MIPKSFDFVFKALSPINVLIYKISKVEECSFPVEIVQNWLNSLHNSDCINMKKFIMNVR